MVLIDLDIVFCPETDNVKPRVFAPPFQFFLVEKRVHSTSPRTVFFLSSIAFLSFKAPCFSCARSLGFLKDQAILMFDGYQEGISWAVGNPVACTVMLYLDDDCLELANIEVH